MAEDRELQQMAAQEAMRQAVGLLTTMALTAGIIYLVSHRYLAEQLARNARAWLDHRRDPHRARDARAVAELQRDISVYEHEQAARGRPGRIRPRGLYER